MSNNPDTAAQVYLRRKQKNLDFFKVSLPKIYQILENQMLTRAELVVTPGAKDLDMTIDGQSCYRGLAKEYSEDEALQFLKENPPEKPLKTFAPEWPSSYPADRFASVRVRHLLEASPVTPENFEGYLRGNNFFPSIVFLGCGLGFHIQAVLERTTVVSAFIVEREPEKFALSLFTVDWAAICAKFKRRGHSINFAIGLGNGSENIQSILARHLKGAVPFYPFMTTYYNHLADIELAEAAMEVSKDVATIAAHWSNYDDQLIRLRNTAFNVSKGICYLKKKNLPASEYPLVVVGSGPSIDHRIDSLKSVRDRVLIVSAGTGLRPLLMAGIKPDLHVELDPGYSIYEIHADLGADTLKDIPLLAVNEINPHVPELFGRTRYYFKSDNAVPALLGIPGDGFPGCNPTCTNAALSISYSLGFRKLFLFGTDYGFESKDKDHASTSIHGDKADTDFALQFRAKVAKRKRPVFEVPGVGGGRIYTRSDYYSAKRSVEQLLMDLESAASSMKVFNCADGAEIEGAIWLAEEDFVKRVEDLSAEDLPNLDERFDSIEAELGRDTMDDALPDLVAEIRRETSALARLVKKTKLGGARDLALLANELKTSITRIKPKPGGVGVTGAQLAMNQVLQGGVLRLVHVGLSHGLACHDGKERDQFIRLWRDQVVDLLEALPDHFQRVMSDARPMADNPWSRTGIRFPEPELYEQGGS